MSELDGVLRKTHEVHCIACERPYLGLSGYRRSAEQELRADGWKKLKGHWTCWACVMRTKP
jgi:hypothetical protein